MQGWVTLHRKLIKWEWYQDSKMVHLFIHLLLIANHEPKNWRGVNINRGQVVTGLKSLNADTGISTQTLRTCLSRLEKAGNLTSKSTNRFRIITLCNYDTYQTKKETTNKPTNKQLTNNQQATNKQLTPNNNDNNDNNETSSGFFTLADVQGAGCLIGFRDPECKAFFTHYNAQGWKLGNGLPIVDLSSAMTKWRNNGYKFPDKPQPKESEDKQFLRQCEQRVGDFIRTGDIEHIRQDQAQNLKNPKFKAWAVSQRAELAGVV